jgi:hypothetical protein
MSNISHAIDNFSLELIPTRVHLFNTHPENRKSILGHLLPILLDTQFFCISQCDQEISLVIPISHAPLFSKLSGMNRMEETFAVIRIFQDTHQINEHGIVNKISKLFAERDIPILYINSFNNNYVLIPEDKLESLHDFIEV